MVGGCTIVAASVELKEIETLIDLFFREEFNAAAILTIFDRLDILVKSIDKSGMMDKDLNEKIVEQWLGAIEGQLDLCKAYIDSNREQELIKKSLLVARNKIIKVHNFFSARGITSDELMDKYDLRAQRYMAMQAEFDESRLRTANS